MGKFIFLGIFCHLGKSHPSSINYSRSVRKVNWVRCQLLGVVTATISSSSLSDLQVSKEF